MKNFNFKAVIGLMAIALLVFWSSCNKYDQATETVSKLTSNNSKEISVNGGMLVFSTQNYFNEVLKDLRTNRTYFENFGYDLNNFRSQFLILKELEPKFNSI